MEILELIEAVRGLPMAAAWHRIKRGETTGSPGLMGTELPSTVVALPADQDPDSRCEGQDAGNTANRGSI